MTKFKGGGVIGLYIGGLFDLFFLVVLVLSINIDNKLKISKLVIYMSKTLWHTMTIKVPSEMVEITKAGKGSIKKTLTKMNNISRSQGYPSIKLVSSSDNKPHIITDGKEWNIEQLKTTLNKSNALAKKNKGRNILTNNSHSSLNRFKSNVKSHAQNLVSKQQVNSNLIRDLENELERLKRQYSEVITTISIGNRTRELVNLGLSTKEQHSAILNQLKTLTNKVYDKLPRYNFF